MSAITAAEYRHVAGLFPTGVTVITRMLPSGRPYGMTVSSFTTVSLEPPLVLVCVDLSAQFLRNFELGDAFLINVLGEEQQHLARRFASRLEEDRFLGIPWSAGWMETPLLEGTVASFACRLDRRVDAGDHAILIGAVEKVQQHSGRPLVWCDRGYHCLPAQTSTE
jgi:(E)-2-((N-methylformamido)methylene)succinate hydrolase